MYFFNIDFLQDSDDDDFIVYSGDVEYFSFGVCNFNKKQIGLSIGILFISMVISNVYVFNIKIG